MAIREKAIKLLWSKEIGVKEIGVKGNWGQTLIIIIKEIGRKLGSGNWGQTLIIIIKLEEK